MPRASRTLPLAGLFVLLAAGSPAKEFTSMCGGFSAGFHAEPNLMTDVVDVPTGGFAPVISFSLETGAETFTVEYIDYPVETTNSTTADLLLGALTRNAVVKLAGELVEEDAVSLSGYPGVVYAVRYGTPPYVSRSKSILAGNRLFTVTAVHPAADTARSTAFLDSFSLDPGFRKLFSAGLPGGAAGWRIADAMCLASCSRGAASALRCDQVCSCYRERTTAGMSEAEYSALLQKIRTGKPAEGKLAEESRAACLGLPAPTP